MKKNLGGSLKWSTAGEVIAKLVTPITNMILARVLVPEDFGIIATVNMIITFVDLFTDSGFAKYIIQFDFEKDESIDDYVTVAFWTNLSLSVFLWILIVVFRYDIAKVVGNTGYETVIVIAATQLMVTSFSSIQIALFRRYFDFKTLFVARVITSVIPLCVTVPLAIIIHNYWALVIGTLIQQIINAVFLTIKSPWKPKLFYSFKKLEKMLSFSIWSLAEAVGYWLTTWFDVFIIGASFSAYYLGIYKNSLNMVNSVMMLVKASIMPVLFSSLSRLKLEKKEFSDVYYGLQETAALVLIPMGIGLFMYRDLATLILFGNKWGEAANIVGAWALASCFSAVFVNFYGEALKAKGLPRILFVYEIICLLVMIPVCYYAKSFGFWSVVYTRAGCAALQIAIGLFFMKKYCEFDIIKMLTNNTAVILCCLFMVVTGLVMKSVNKTMVWQLVSIIVCAAVYFLSYYLLFRKRLTRLIKIYNDR